LLLPETSLFVREGELRGLFKDRPVFNSARRRARNTSTR
jgi:hypothetical protein